MADDGNRKARAVVVGALLGLNACGEAGSPSPGAGGAAAGVTSEAGTAGLGGRDPAGGAAGGAVAGALGQAGSATSEGGASGAAGPISSGGRGGFAGSVAGDTSSGGASGGVESSGGSSGGMESSGGSSGGMESSGGSESGDGAGGATAGAPATLSFQADIWPMFEKIRDPIFEYYDGSTYESCVTGGVCHGGVSPGARLRMPNAEVAYENLLDVESQSDLCAGTVRVVPGEPDVSCLIAFYETRLRDELAWVDDTEIDQVRAWIAQGAAP